MSAPYPSKRCTAWALPCSEQMWRPVLLVVLIVALEAA